MLRSQCLSVELKLPLYASGPIDYNSGLDDLQVTSRSEYCQEIHDESGAIKEVSSEEITYWCKED